MILSTSILLGMLKIESKAVNETNSNSQNVQNTTNTQGTSNNTQNNSSNETTNQEPQEKSSNANLAILGIKPNDFTGFRYGTTTYEVEVPEEVDEVEVYAKVQDEKATMTGTGKKSLEKGDNKAQVVVTAENGATKTYTINIFRGIKKTEDLEGVTDHAKEQGKGLSKLKINDLKLSPNFQTNHYEYTVKYIGEDTKLNVQTEATNESYVIEVIGNDNLQEGKNIITILVSEENDNNIATYQITVEKSLVDKEVLEKEEALKKAQGQKVMIGIAIAVVAVIAVVISVIIIRKRNKRLEDEFSGSFYDEDENFEEEEEEELPKALRGKRFQEEVRDEEEDDYDRMPKDALKERFLNGYTSQLDLDFEDNFEEAKPQRKPKKGKRFK